MAITVRPVIKSKRIRSIWTRGKNSKNWGCLYELIDTADCAKCNRHMRIGE